MVHWTQKGVIGRRSWPGFRLGEFVGKMNELLREQRG